MTLVPSRCWQRCQCQRPSIYQGGWAANSPSHCPPSPTAILSPSSISKNAQAATGCLKRAACPREMGPNLVPLSAFELAQQSRQSDTPADQASDKVMFSRDTSPCLCSRTFPESLILYFSLTCFFPPSLHRSTRAKTAEVPYLARAGWPTKNLGTGRNPIN